MPAKKAKATPAKSSRSKKAAVKDETEDEEEAPVSAKKGKVTPAKSSRGKKAPVKDDTEEEEDVPAPAKKPKATAKTTKATDTKAAGKTGRKPAKKVAANDSADEEPAPKAKARRTSRSSKA